VNLVGLLEEAAVGDGEVPVGTPPRKSGSSWIAGRTDTVVSHTVLDVPFLEVVGRGT
jgi:hypothetical protein